MLGAVNLIRDRRGDDLAVQVEPPAQLAGLGIERQEVAGDIGCEDQVAGRPASPIALCRSQLLRRHPPRFNPHSAALGQRFRPTRF
jgi:hypothetical protein